VNSPKKLNLWIAIGLFILALGLRGFGIGWGLQNDLHNQSYHPDELPIFAASQQIVPTQGKFTPGFYNYGTLYLTVLRVASDAVTAYTGGPVENDANSTWAWVSRIHQVGRWLSALCGAGTVVFVFLKLRRFVGQFGAVFGALVPLVAPAFVVHSRFQTVDVPATFLLAASTFFAVLLLPTEDDPEPKNLMRWAMLSGLFAGLSAGTKYTGILVLATLVIAAFFGARKDWLKLSVTAIGVALLSFVICTPGVVLDTTEFLTDFKYEMAHTSTGHGLVFVGTSSGFLYHISNLLVGVGPLLTLLGILGLGIGARQKQPWIFAIIAFALIYFVLIGRAEVKFLRYTFPLIVGLAAGFGVFMDYCEKQPNLGRIGAALGIAGIGGIDPGGMRQAINLTLWMTGDDPRDSAVQYLRTQQGNVGIASLPWFYTAPTYRNATLGPQASLSSRLGEMQETANPPTVFFAQSPDDPYAFNLGLLEQTKPDRIAISSFEYGDPLRIKAAGIEPKDPVEKLLVDRAVTFMEAIKKDYEIDKAFGIDGIRIHDLEYIRPELMVWKRKSTN